jgi:aminopeptidase N
MFMRLIIVLFFAATKAFASDPYPKNESIKVDHYAFHITVNDTTDIIGGEALVTIRFLKPVASFDLNLIGKKNGEKGMEVSSVTSSGKPVEYSFKNDLITINTPDAKANDKVTYTVVYKGIPADGLIISKNKFEDRTFFADNWPDRGRHWLPTIDHPSYKATVEFVVYAPPHYSVIGPGKFMGEYELPNSTNKLTHWSETVPISVKVMAIGIARFVAETQRLNPGVPVMTWVYPQNKDEGFLDFSAGGKILQYLQEYIGPYPFEKLAHVQSKTKFGGLENASNIFYFENSVNGKNEREGLIAHETAHQWFGDSATERDWYHVWLSEGFATYFTAIYMEHAYGKEKLAEVMQENRTRVLEFAEKNHQPIIDTTIVDINNVLSTNTYQKASWVLHMLRKKIGDDNFHKGIREYYKTFRDSTALTSDFVTVMQKYSKEDLNPFFQRWLYIGGHPKITGTWYWNKKRKTVFLDVEMTGNDKYSVPLEVLVDSKVEPLVIEPGKQQLRIHSNEKPTKIALDPGTNLLFEGAITAK